MKPQPFRDADEKDELLSEIRRLMQTAAALGKVRSLPALVAYRLTSADTAAPLLPTQDEMAVAQAALQQTAVCLVHHYNLRRRWDDDELALTPERDELEQDNDTPF